MTTLDVESLAKEFYGYFIRRKIPHWDAEDLVQELFCKLLKMERPIDSWSKAYLYSVARTLMIDRYWEHKGRMHLFQKTFEENDQALLEEAYNSPEYDLQALQLHRKFDSGLHSMTHLQQQTFTAYMFQGRPIKDIAKNHLVSVSAVEKVMERARKTIRENVAAF